MSSKINGRREKSAEIFFFFFVVYVLHEKERGMVGRDVRKMKDSTDVEKMSPSYATEKRAEGYGQDNEEKGTNYGIALKFRMNSVHLFYN